MSTKLGTVPVIAMLIVLGASCLYAQGPDSLWHRAYGDTLSDFGFSGQETFDGGYIAVGQIQVYDPDSNKIFVDIFLVKTDSDGNTVWAKIYGGPRSDGSRDVRQTADSGYVIAGYTDSFGAGDIDLYLIKTDANGDTTWARTYGDSRNDEVGHCVRQAPDGGYFVVGDIQPKGTTGSGVYLIRTDQDGKLLWQKTYGADAHASARELALVPDGGCIIAGAIIPSATFDVYLIRTDANGDSIWARTYGGGGNDYGMSVKQISDGAFYIVAGYAEAFVAPGYNVYLLKIQPNGDSVWARTYGGPNDDAAHSVAIVSDGGYVITGYTDSFGAGNDDVYLIRTDTNGDTLWTATYGGISNDWGGEVAETSDGGFIIAGSTASFGPGYISIYLLKTGPDQAGICKDEFSGDTVLNLRIMPNPSETEVTIEYRLPFPSDVRTVIYNLLGQEVRLLEARDSRSGHHAVVWDGKNSQGNSVPVGIYFCRIEAGDLKASHKLARIK